MTSRGTGPLGSLAPLGGRRYSRIANVILAGTVTSTNDFARRIVERLLSEDSELLPTVILAARQTAGRGRGGREWLSPGEGSLALSLILPWPEGRERIRVPVETGVRLATGLSERFKVPVRLKWPNDLLVGRRKVGGILVEARAGEDGTGFAVVGIGLNLSTTRSELDAAGLPDATALAVEGAPREALEGDEGVAAVLGLLDEALGEEIVDLAAAFLSVSAHAPGDVLSVRDGERVVTGAFLGVNADGMLRLDTSSGTETLVSGEIASF